MTSIKDAQERNRLLEADILRLIQAWQKKIVATGKGVSLGSIQATYALTPRGRVDHALRKLKREGKIELAEKGGWRTPPSNVGPAEQQTETAAPTPPPGDAA